MLPTRRRVDTALHTRTGFITLAKIVLVMAVGDALVFSWRPENILRQYWSLLDSPVHAVLALLVVSPFFARRSCGGLYRRIVTAGLFAVLLDLDHFVLSQSFSLYEATHLSGRPVTHSLLFALGCGLLVYLLTRSVRDAWLVSIVLASHVLRDASSGGTPYLWPISADHLAVPAYYAAEVGLYLLARAMASYQSGRNNNPTSFFSPNRVQ